MERKYLELVEGSFTQEHLDKQNNQKPYVAYSIKDGNVIYNIVPNEDGTMYTICRVVNKDISNCTYNMVDLGLSVKWADRNVGASSPEHCGSYFQWGDTNAYTFEGKVEVTAAELASLLQPIIGDEMEVTADNVGSILEMSGISGTDLTVTGICFSSDKTFNWESYFDTNDGGSTFNKYAVDKLTVLESEDDTATQNMGSDWRMPTSKEFEELIENTTQIFIDIQGNEYSKEQAQNGAISEGSFKGVHLIANNGNSIFIPSNFTFIENVSPTNTESFALWLSSMVYENGTFWEEYARDGICSLNKGGFLGGTLRYIGLPVRGVQP